MDEFPLSSGEERALGKLAKSGDAGISSRFDDAMLRAYKLAPSKESLLLRAEEDIGKMSDKPRLPSVFEVPVQDASASRPPPSVSSSSAGDTRSPSPARKTSSRSVPTRTSSKAKSSSTRTPTKAKLSSTRTSSKGASRKTSSSVPAPARTGSDPAPVVPAVQVDSSSSPHHTSTPGVSLPFPARAPAPAPSFGRIPANRRKLVLLKSPPSERPATSPTSSTLSAKRPAETSATPTAPSKRSKSSADDQAPVVAAFSEVPAAVENQAAAPSSAAPSEVPLSNVFANLQSFPSSSL